MQLRHVRIALVVVLIGISLYMQTLAPSPLLTSMPASSSEQQEEHPQRSVRTTTGHEVDEEEARLVNRSSTGNASSSSQVSNSRGALPSDQSDPGISESPPLRGEPPAGGVARRDHAATDPDDHVDPSTLGASTAATAADPPPNAVHVFCRQHWLPVRLWWYLRGVPLRSEMMGEKSETESERVDADIKQKQQREINGGGDDDAAEPEVPVPTVAGTSPPPTPILQSEKWPSQVVSHTTHRPIPFVAGVLCPRYYVSVIWQRSSSLNGGVSTADQGSLDERAKAKLMNRIAQEPAHPSVMVADYDEVVYWTMLTQSVPDGDRTTPSATSTTPVGDDAGSASAEVGKKSGGVTFEEDSIGKEEETGPALVNPRKMSTNPSSASMPSGRFYVMRRREAVMRGPLVCADALHHLVATATAAGDKGRRRNDIALNLGKNALLIELPDENYTHSHSHTSHNGEDAPPTPTCEWYHHQLLPFPSADAEYVLSSSLMRLSKQQLQRLNIRWRQEAERRIFRSRVPDHLLASPFDVVRDMPQHARTLARLVGKDHLFVGPALAGGGNWTGDDRQPVAVPAAALDDGPAALREAAQLTAPLTSATVREAMSRFWLLLEPEGELTGYGPRSRLTGNVRRFSLDRALQFREGLLYFRRNISSKVHKSTREGPLPPTAGYTKDDLVDDVGKVAIDVHAAHRDAATQFRLLHECFNPVISRYDRATTPHFRYGWPYSAPFINVIPGQILPVVLAPRVKKSHGLIALWRKYVAQSEVQRRWEALRDNQTQSALLPSRMHCLASMAAAIADRVVAVTRSDDRILTAVAERTGHVAGLLPPALQRERRVSRLGAMSGDWNSSALPSWLRIPSRVNVGNCFAPSAPVVKDDATRKLPTLPSSSFTPPSPRSILVVGSSHARSLFNAICLQLAYNSGTVDPKDFARINSQCTPESREVLTTLGKDVVFASGPPGSRSAAADSYPFPYPLAMCRQELQTLSQLLECVRRLVIGLPSSASMPWTTRGVPPSKESRLDLPKLMGLSARSLKKTRGLFTHIVVVPGVWEATFGDETAPERAENTALLLEVLEELFAPRRMVLYNMHGIHTPEGTDEWAFDAALQGEGPAAGVALGRTRAPLLACRSRVRSYRDAQLCGASVYGRRRVREAWAARLGVAPGGEAGGPRAGEVVDFHAATRSSLGRLFVDDAGHHYNEVVLEAMTQRLLRDYVCPPRYALAVPEGADGEAAVSRGDVLGLPGLPARSPVARGGSPVAVELVPGGLEVSLPVLERRVGGALAVRGLLPLMRAPDAAVAEAVCRTIWDSAEGVAAGGAGAVAWAHRRSRAPAEPAASEAPVPASRAANPFAIVPDCACLRTRRLVEGTGNASVALEDAQVGGRRSCAFRGHLFSEPGRCADIRRGLTRTRTISCSKSMTEELLYNMQHGPEAGFSGGKRKKKK